MLAWKSWKRGPEGQPLLPTFRVQTIAICLVAAGIMQRALCHSVTRLVLLVKVINKRHASVFLFLFLFRHPRPVSLHLFLSLSLSLARARVAATKPEYVGDVLRKQGQLSSPEFMNVWEFFARHCGNLWLAFSPRIIIVPASCPHRRIMQILGCFRDEWVGLKRIRGRLAVVCSLVCHSRMLLE